MSVGEAAKRLGRCREYLYSGLREGRFPGSRFGRGWSLPRTFVAGFIAEAEAGSSQSFEDYAARWLAKATAEVAV